MRLSADMDCCRATEKAAAKDAGTSAGGTGEAPREDGLEGVGDSEVGEDESSVFRTCP